MPKISVYLSQDLYDRARKESLPLSSIAQEAIENALRRDDVNDWIETMRSRPVRAVLPFDISAIMAEVRDEFGT